MLVTAQFKILIIHKYILKGLNATCTICKVNTVTTSVV
jgi:hypothetical protein